MKAAQIAAYGDASVIKINDVEVPKPSDDQVLIKVHASSLNPFDTIVRAGYMKDMIPLRFPATLGGDISGVVTEVGKNVTSLNVGDKVFGQANVVSGNSGAFAEFAATTATQIALMPSNLSFNDAASLPLVGVSALQALTVHINLKPGQKLFIHGGAGGIGTVAIQIAKNIGAYVATTATGEGLDYVKQLGADEVIDYKAEDFADKLKDYDAVYDNVGGEEFNKALTILKRGGSAVSMTAQADEPKVQELSVTATTQMTKVTTEALDKLRELIEKGVVTPHVDSTYPLDKIAEAFQARESGLAKGKVVIEIR